MAFASEHFGYEWLDTTTERPGAYMQVASCFYFFDGISVDEVVRFAGVRDAQPRGPLTDTDEPADFDTAIFDAGNGWTVVYQDNGWPDQYAHAVAQARGVDRAVVVYWNVNARTEFSYWEGGECVVRFDVPADRTGSDPDRLLVDMNETVGPLGQEAAGTVGAYYARMLALAERITGIHLGPDFLDRPALVVGSAGEDYNGESYQVTYVPWAPRIGLGLRGEQLLGDIPMSLRPELREPLARRACEAAGIAGQEPIRSALEALRRHKPLPAPMTNVRDVLAHIRADLAQPGVPDQRQTPSAPGAADPAVRAVFTAADPDSAMDLALLLDLSEAATGRSGETLIREVCAERGYG